MPVKIKKPITLRTIVLLFWCGAVTYVGGVTGILAYQFTATTEALRGHTLQLARELKTLEETTTIFEGLMVEARSVVESSAHPWTRVPPGKVQALREKVRLGLRQDQVVEASGAPLDVPTPLRLELVRVVDLKATLGGKLLETVALVERERYVEADETLREAGATSHQVRASLARIQDIAMQDLLDRGQSLQAASEKARRAALVWFLAGFLLMPPLFWFLHRRVYKPLKDLNRGFERLAQGEPRVEVPVQRRDELGLLADQFNRTAVLLQVQSDLERRQARRAIDASEERFSLVFGMSPDPIAITTFDDAVYVDVNESFQRATGYARQEVIGRSAMELGIWPDPRDREEIVSRLRERDVTQMTGFETTLRRKSGEAVAVLLSVQKLEIVDQQCLLWFAKDISDRKRAEEALARSEARFRDLFQNANDIILTLDPQGVVTSVNKQGQETTGYDCQPEEQLNVTSLVAPESLPFARQQFARILAGESCGTFEIEALKKSGEKVTIEVNGRPIAEHGAVVGVQVIGRDVTERRELEMQLRQAQKMEAMGQLAGGVAHDFNNLLNVIMGYSDLIADKVAANTNLSRHAQEITRAAQRAASLTRQLLIFSRKQAVEFKVLDLNTVVSDMAKLLKRLLGAQVSLKIKTASDLRRIRADAGQMEQVIMNLAVNARDAMPEGGTLTIETSNFVMGEGEVRNHPRMQPGPYVRLTVSDTGVGMDAATQARIFEPFFTTKEAGKGTGLGLATVYGIVEQAGGVMWVDSQLGLGTTFRIYLPCVEAKPDAQDTANRSVPTKVGRLETILVVEDDESLREMMRLHLESAGFKTLLAGDGESAIEASRRHAGDIHLLLTDVALPRLSGPALARHLSKSRPQMKLLFVSGYSDGPLEQQLIENGAPLIQKPIRAVELIQHVVNAIDVQAN